MVTRGELRRVTDEMRLRDVPVHRSRPVVIVHLVMDEDHGRTACTGERWEHPGDSGPRVPHQLCGACRLIGARG